jgi:hypothetical protein
MKNVAFVKFNRVSGVQSTTRVVQCEEPTAEIFVALLCEDWDIPVDEFDGGDVQQHNGNFCIDYEEESYLMFAV